MKRSIIFLSAVMLLLSSCGLGATSMLSGKDAEKTFEVGDYRVLSVSNAINVTYSDTAGQLTVKADETVLPYVRVEEKSGKLKIYLDIKDNVRFRNGNYGEISVVVPSSSSLEKVVLSGASDFTGEKAISAETLLIDISGASDFNSDLNVSGELSVSASGASDFTSVVNSGELSIDASGASDVNVSGKTVKYSVSASGASSVSSGRAFVETSDFLCDVSGASSCHVRCSGTATGKASGASSVTVYGQGNIRISTSGASHVRYRD